MKILLVDNYDSFSYNLAYMFREKGIELEVLRNDKLDIDPDTYDGYVLSPGPGIPEKAGDLVKLIRRLGKDKPILGVCLGHQAIAEVYGARLYNMKKVFHGVQDKIYQKAKASDLFHGLPRMFSAGRYHSWSVSRGDLPGELEPLAIDETGELMAIRLKGTAIYGIQFHPESIMTPQGHLIIDNFLKICKSSKNEKSLREAV